MWNVYLLRVVVHQAGNVRQIVQKLEYVVSHLVGDLFALSALFSRKPLFKGLSQPIHGSAYCVKVSIGPRASI